MIKLITMKLYELQNMICLEGIHYNFLENILEYEFI